jgi:hypothetical protein
LLNIVGKRYWYFALSLLIIIPGSISLVTHGLRLGADFTGGTEIQFDVPAKNGGAQIESILLQVTSNVSFVQPVISSNCPPHCQYIARTKQLTPKQYAVVKLLSSKQWKTGGPVQQQTTSGTISSSWWCGRTARSAGSSGASLAGTAVPHLPRPLEQQDVQDAPTIPRVDHRGSIGFWLVVSRARSNRARVLASISRIALKPR